MQPSDDQAIDEAEPHLRRALTLAEERLGPAGPDHPDVAFVLNSLGVLYKYIGRYDEAERLYRRALAIKENVLGPDHVDVALTLGNLAMLYKTLERYAEAEAC
jgi:tetratricopeptide (TPR) repeat protein